MSVERDLRETIARLELLSHVSAVEPGASSKDTSDDIGGKRPPGGVDRRDEKRDTLDEIFTLKSADHFRRRMVAARTDHALEVILVDALRSLNAWKRQPLPTSEPDSRAHPQWKAWVAFACVWDDGEVARKYGCSRQYVNRIRRAYRLESAA